MSHADSMELLAICDKAKAQNDLRWYDRIQRYFESAGDDPAAKRRAKRRAAQEMELDETEMSAMCDAIFKLISPQDIHRLIKLHGKNGASAALVEKLAASSAGHTLPRPALAGIADMMIQLILGHDASPF
jgi:hypothetical protein